jgi:four helix bundle protein
MKYPSFTDMPVLNEAMDLSVEIFKHTISIPKSEDYGLTSQIRRLSGSVQANIAESFGRNTSSYKNKFYIYSKGSVTETQSHLIYGKHVGYFNEGEVNILFDCYNSLLHDLNKIIKSLK